MSNLSMCLLEMMLCWLFNIYTKHVKQDWSFSLSSTLMSWPVTFWLLPLVDTTCFFNTLSPPMRMFPKNSEFSPCATLTVEHRS